MCDTMISFGSLWSSDNCGVTQRQSNFGGANNSRFAVGMQQVGYIVSDAAGNSKSCNFSVGVVDLQPPAIVCPSSIQTNSDSSMCSALVGYTAPVGTDNCPGSLTTRTAGLASGGAFSVGTTAVTYFVEDASHQVSSCSFNITVVDNEAPRLGLLLLFFVSQFD